MHNEYDDEPDSGRIESGECLKYGRGSFCNNCKNCSGMPDPDENRRWVQEQIRAWK